MSAHALLKTSLLATGLSLVAPLCLAQKVTAEQIVAAFEKTFGVTPGERRNHIKGTCAIGEFVGLPTAVAYSRSALFSGETVPVIARFSLPGGNPKVADTAKIPRGMALEFKLGDGTLQHMTMINTPLFGAAQPKTLLDQLIAMEPDPATGKPDPEKIKAFRASHPDSLAQADFLDKHNPPTSFATSSYFGIHTFKFIDQKDQTNLVRWRFVPQDGEQRFSDAGLTSLPANFLEQRLVERAEQGPIRWDMIVTLGVRGDPETAPTVAWPEDREQLKVGTLSITAAMPQKGAACEKISIR